MASLLRKGRVIFLPSSHGLGCKVIMGQNIPFSHKRPGLGWAPRLPSRWKKVLACHWSLFFRKQFFPMPQFSSFLFVLFFFFGVNYFLLTVGLPFISYLAGSWRLGSPTDIWPIFSTGDARAGLNCIWSWQSSRFEAYLCWN